MKTILYMAMTVNGYIAKKNHETPWSEEEWKSFSSMVNRTGNIVIGKNTFEIMKKGNEFDEINNPFTLVVTRKENVDKKYNSNTYFVKSPREALNVLEGEGFSEALVAGGSLLNSSFMKENLIDEIYIDIEPLVFGRGIKLFSNYDFERNLKLIETRKISKSTIQLHYKVLK